MAGFTGELQDFYDLVLPKVRNEIATMTKKKKIELEYICQHCNQKKELESAHKKERSLRDIAKNVLEHYKSENDTYVVADLRQLILKIKGEHVPIENSFLFLCAECHRKYDGKSTLKNKIEDDEKQLQNVHVNNEDKSVKINNEGSKNPGMIPQKDQEFSEKELYAQFQVRNSGGIRPSNKNKVIILIKSFFSEIQGGYQDETDGDSGFIYYVGEGEGDQEIKRNNRNIYESKSSGHTMLYFEKPQQNRLYFRYKVEYDSHKFEKQANSNGRMRNVIVFKLKIID